MERTVVERMLARVRYLHDDSSKTENILFSAPGPTTAVSYMSVKCVDVRKNHHKAKWLMPWGPNQCDKIRDIEEAIPREIEANDIVFSVHIPLPSMEMSPWFQFMLFILQLDIAFKLNNQISKCTLPTPSCLGEFLSSGFSEPVIIGVK